MPKISVVIPVYNVEKYVERCLNSVLCQTFADFEAICVNDGSSDNCRSILERYAQKDARVKVINQVNSGVSVARNRGIDIAIGEYLTFLDADDMWHPRFLEVMVSAIEKTKADVAWCRFCTVPEEQEKPLDCDKIALPVSYDHVFDKLIFRSNCVTVNVWDKLYRMNLLKGLSFVPGLSLGEDMLFVHQALYRMKSGVCIDSPLFCYRLRNGSAVHSGLSEKVIDNNLRMATLLDEFIQKKDMSDKTRHVLETQIAKRYLKFCALEPYRKKVHTRLWAKYAPILQDLQQKGIYQPKRLNMRNRLKSYFFTHQYFNLLSLIMKV